MFNDQWKDVHPDDPILRHINLKDEFEKEVTDDDNSEDDSVMFYGGGSTVNDEIVPADSIVIEQKNETNDDDDDNSSSDDSDESDLEENLPRPTDSVLLPPEQPEPVVQENDINIPGTSSSDSKADSCLLYTSPSPRDS